MGALQIAGIGLLSAMAVFLLRELKGIGAPPARMAAVVLLLSAALCLYAPIVLRIKNLFALGEASALALPVLRAAGITLICEFAAGLCRDMGEGSIAEGVLLFGKLEILLLALPLVDELVEIVEALLS